MRYYFCVLISLCFGFSAEAQINSISLVGPAALGNWDEDLQLKQVEDTDGIWELKTYLAEGELKFRANNNWALNWGGLEFPEGIARRDGNNLQVDEGFYLVQFNTNTRNYRFSLLDEQDRDKLAEDLPGLIVNDNGRVIYSGGKINFEAASFKGINSYDWYFEGGQPQTANTSNPGICYQNPGTYDLQLITQSKEGSDTLYLEDYVEVKERNLDEPDWWNETVFYEIFVRSFYDSNGDGIGDFQGLIQKLDYLNDGDPNTDQDLGITGIWLMPIHPSPSYHGYDVSNYKAIHPDYGTEEDFRKFMEEAHKRGIKVIIDLVLNHTSTQHPWFQASSDRSDENYKDWYIWKPVEEVTFPDYSMHTIDSASYYYAAFSSNMPDLNYEHPPVKDSLFNITTFWLNEMNVDGLRLDAVKYLFETEDKRENVAATFDFFQDFSKHYKSVKEDAFAVGEAWTSSEIILNYVEEDRLDFCFEFDLSVAYAKGLQRADATIISEQLQAAYNLYPHLQFGSFLTNHDQTRIIDALKGDRNKARVGASVYLTAPGIPFLYYGEEIGQQGQKPDPQIRTPMQWEASGFGGFSTTSPWIALQPDVLTVNVEAQQNKPGSLWKHYQKLIEIRKKEEALQLGTFSVLPASDSGILAFVRTYQKERILVVINISDKGISRPHLDALYSGLPFGEYRATELMQNRRLNISITEEGELKLPPIGAYQTKLYRLRAGK